MKKGLLLILICFTVLWGQILDNTQIKCPGCGRTIDSDSRFCPYCREEIVWADVKITATPSRTTTFRIQGIEGSRDVPFEGKMVVGTYKVIFQCNGREYSKIFTVSKNGMNSLYHDCSFTEKITDNNFGFVTINVTQKAAYVHIDGNKVEENKRYKIQPSRKIRLRAAAEGYASIDTMVDIPHGQKAMIDITLNPVEYAHEFDCRRPFEPEYLDTVINNPSKFVGLALMSAGLIGIVAPLAINNSDNNQENGLAKDFPTWHKVTIGVSTATFVGGAIFMGKAGKIINKENVEYNRKLKSNYDIRLEDYRICLQDNTVRERIIKKNPVKIFYSPIN